jgi:hypothetical protein
MPLMMIAVRVEMDDLNNFLRRRSHDSFMSHDLKMKRQREIGGRFKI